MKAHLYINPYFETNPDRKKELDYCILKNFEAGFDSVQFLMQSKDNHCLPELSGPIPIVMSWFDARPVFDNYIEEANKTNASSLQDDLHVVMNYDVYMPSESLQKLKELPWEKKLFVALSRYDLTPKDNLILLDRWDSADTWVWKGPTSVEGINCSCGFAGVDNHVAWKFKEAGYRVVNPSRDIVTVHVHNVHINNYREGGSPNGAVKADNICPEPYAFHPPIKISEI